MDTRYVSLAQLLESSHHERYDQLAVPIQGALRNSVWLTLITGVVSTIVLVALPQEFWLSRAQPGGFFLGPIADIVNSLLSVGYALLPWLLILNVFNLFLTLILLTISFGMLFPAKQSVLKLAWANAVPAVLTAGAFIIIVGLFTIIVVITIGIWIILIILGLIFAAVVLAGLVSSLGS